MNVPNENSPSHAQWQKRWLRKCVLIRPSLLGLFCAQHAQYTRDVNRKIGVLKLPIINVRGTDCQSGTFREFDRQPPTGSLPPHSV